MSNRFFQEEFRLLAVDEEMNEPLPLQLGKEANRRSDDEGALLQLSVSSELLICLSEQLFGFSQCLEPVENGHIDI